eukprot:scaffold27438_cov108-Isochrysis_galbana.AAC.6
MQGEGVRLDGAKKGCWRAPAVGGHTCSSHSPATLTRRGPRFLARTATRAQRAAGSGYSASRQVAGRPAERPARPARGWARPPLALASAPLRACWCGQPGLSWSGSA